MGSYWLWFFIMAVSWLLAFIHGAEYYAVTWRYLGSAVFFSLFFLVPLLRGHPKVLTVLLSLNAVTAAAVLWPEIGAEPNLYLLLVLSVLAGKAAYRLPGPDAALTGAVIFAAAAAPAVMDFPSFPLPFIILYATLLAAALSVFKRTKLNETDAGIRQEMLLSEYRKLKRRVASDEKQARADERAQIAREIHDSVGHKLTALLMQLEVARMQAGPETEKKLGELKKLAKDSLEETRGAVKTLSHDAAGGLSAILSLIRKLEAESYMRINFTVRHGAMSAQLGNEQAVAVYRAVQEALTNTMRHSQARQAAIMFESPGGGIFRFEVTNPEERHITVQEGFGLSAMRERIEKAGGSLEIHHYNRQFIVRGTLPLRQMREDDEV